MNKNYFEKCVAQSLVHLTEFQLDFDRKIFTPTNLNVGTRPKFMTPTNIHSSARKKTSGTEVRRTLDIRLRFVGFIRFAGFNFGHVQLLRFVLSGFNHIHSVILNRSSEYSSLLRLQILLNIFLAVCT